MDPNRLRAGELIAGVSAVVLFIVMFLPWFGLDLDVPDEARDAAESLGVSLPSANLNAWVSFSFIDIVLFVTIIVAVAFAAAAATSQSVALPVAASAITTVLGILSTILILYRVIDPPEDLGRKFWLWVGLISAAGIAYGGWRAMQEEGTTFGAEADRIQGRMGGDRPPPPPPPPPSGPAA